MKKNGRRAKQIGVALFFHAFLAAIYIVCASLICWAGFAFVRATIHAKIPNSVAAWVVVVLAALVSGGVMLHIGGRITFYYQIKAQMEPDRPDE